MMTEFAQPIALRFGLAVGSAALVVFVLDKATLVWTDALAAIGLSLIAYGGAYIFVYIAEQYLYETGRLTRPHWMTGAQKIEVTDEYVADSSKGLLRITDFDGHTTTLDPEAGDAYVRLGVDASGRDLKLIPLMQAIGEGMDKISKRQLQSYGVIQDRTSDEGDAIIEHLTERHLVDDMGNNQYAVTGRLISYLSRVTGEPYVQRIRANPQEMGK